MIKTALVTGATSGIGRAIALTLAHLGYNVAITGRRLPLLQNLCNELERTSGVESYILNFDLRDKHDVFDSYDILPDSWKKNLKVLVNNAGIAIGDESFDNCDDNEWDQMIDTNVKGMLYISQLVSQTMRENGCGHIINITSADARISSQGCCVYNATKQAVDSLTKSMRIDLMPYGIKVSSIAPGIVNTDFSTNKYRGDIERGSRIYKGIRPLSPDDVASAVKFIVNRPDHVCISDLVLMPSYEADAEHIYRKDD